MLPSTPFLALGGRAAAAGLPLTGLTHRWPMDDAHVSGATITDTVGGLDATAHGGVSSTAGPAGTNTARAFDGVAGTYLTLASSPIPAIPAANVWSVGFWLKLADITARGSNNFRATPVVIVNSAGTDELRIVNDNNVGDGFISFSFVTTEIAPAAANIANNTWVSIMFVHNGTTYTMYVNGSAVSTQSVATSAGNGVISIGSIDTGNGSLNGAMAGLSIYSVALTAGQALAWHNAGSS